MPVSRPFAAAGVLLGLLVLPSGEARAQQQETGPSGVTEHDLDPSTGAMLHPPSTRLDYLNIGPILSLVGGFAHATGVGLEASWIGYPEGRLPSFGVGAFYQAQLYDGKYFRTAGGAEFTAGPAGLEVGLAFRQTDGTYASTIATHTGAFLSLGYFYIAVRASAQLLAFPSNEPSFGLETAFTFGLKLPLAINGRDPSGAAIQLDHRAQ